MEFGKSLLTILEAEGRLLMIIYSQKNMKRNTKSKLKRRKMQ